MSDQDDQDTVLLDAKSVKRFEDKTFDLADINLSQDGAQEKENFLNSDLLDDMVKFESHHSHFSRGLPQHTPNISRPVTQLQDHISVKGTSLSIPIKFEQLKQ